MNNERLERMKKFFQKAKRGEAMKISNMTFLIALVVALNSTAIFAADAPKMKMTTNIP